MLRVLLDQVPGRGRERVEDAVLVAARRRATPTGTPPAPPVAALTEASAAAARALVGDDPRTAVLRCYAAMATALRLAVVPGRASDVPGELLRRAADAGTVEPDQMREQHEHHDHAARPRLDGAERRPAARGGADEQRKQGDEDQARIGREHQQA